MTIYDRIRAKREELGMTQDTLAKLCGYTDRSTIAKIELGQRDLTQGKIVRFAEALKTTPSYLMGWDEEPELVVEALTPEQLSMCVKISQMTPDEMARLSEMAKLLFPSKF